MLILTNSILLAMMSFYPVVNIHVDFGHVPYGQTYYAEAQLINQQNTTIEITSIRSTCNCSIAQAVKKKVAPRDSVRFRLKLEYTDNDADSIENSIYAHAEWGKSYQYYIFRLSARIDKPVLLMPQKAILNVKQVPGTKEFTGGIILENICSGRLVISQIYSPDKVVTDKVFPITVDQSESVEINYTGGSASFLNFRSITFESSDGLFTERLSVPILIE